MERILVFSDSHGETKNMKQIIENMPGVTAVIHLGDLNRDIQFLEDNFFDFPIYGVQGNNDFSGLYPNEKMLTIGEKKIFITHGHYYLSHWDSAPLKHIPQAAEADLILFGHTHVAEKELFDGKILANPGSISRPRMGNASYGVIEIENQTLNYCNIELPSPFSFFR